MTTDLESLTIDATRAAVIYSALILAIADTNAALKLKSGSKFKSAITLQLSAYRAEMAKLAAAFPELNQELNP